MCMRLIWIANWVASLVGIRLIDNEAANNGACIMCCCLYWRAVYIHARAYCAFSRFPVHNKPEKLPNAWNCEIRVRWPMKWNLTLFSTFVRVHDLAISFTFSPISDNFDEGQEYADRMQYTWAYQLPVVRASLLDNVASQTSSFVYLVTCTVNLDFPDLFIVCFYPYRC